MSDDDQVAAARQPFPAQVLWHSIPEALNQFHGGTRGSGKTEFALQAMLAHCFRYADRAHALFTRATDKSLLEAWTEFTMMAKLADPGCRVNQADRLARFSNGALAEFGMLDNADQYRRYQGRSITMLVSDEMGAVRDPKWIMLLRSNLRGPEGVPLRTIFLANPGGANHAWCHKNFVAKNLAFHPFEWQGEQWVYVPSSYLDNPHIDHADYERKIRSACAGNEALVRCWLFNDWNVSMGAFFAEALDEKVHMLPTAFPFPVTPAWRPFLAMDYGSGAPCYIAYCLRATGEHGPWAKGSLLIVDETALAKKDEPNVGLGWPPAKIAEAIHEKCAAWNIPAHGVGDDYKGLEDTLLEVFRGLKIYLVKPQKARVAGWAKVLELLHNAKEQNGRPGLYVSARCKYWWATVPFLARDEDKPNDCDTNGCDHSADTTRYATLHLNQGAVAFGRAVGIV